MGISRKSPILTIFQKSQRTGECEKNTLIQSLMRAKTLFFTKKSSFPLLKKYCKRPIIERVWANLVDFGYLDMSFTVVIEKCLPKHMTKLRVERANVGHGDNFQGW